MARKTDRAGWVYVLHFNEPIAHAQHYIGCTENLFERLTTHAQGRGATIVKECLCRGIGFRVGAVGMCNLTELRSIERGAKDWHGASEFCEVCNAESRRIPGTTPIALEQLAFSPRSCDLWPQFATPPEAVVRITDAHEPIALSETIQRMMQANKHALGFVPAGADRGVTRDIASGRVAVATKLDRFVGYCLFGVTDVIRVHQLCVHDAHRGEGIGRKLLDTVRAAHPGLPMVSKVRGDLPANGFWQHVGFAKTGTDRHATSNSLLNCYRAE